MLLIRSPGSLFVVDVLVLWVISEAPFHGWKTGGRTCAEEIVKPVIAWWKDPTGEIQVKDKYRRPAEALASELDRIAWELFGEQRRVNELIAQ